MLVPTPEIRDRWEHAYGSATNSNQEIAMYEVICDEPDGGDVIEGRLPAAKSHHATLGEALWRMYSWYRAGPNGPVRSAVIRKNGKKFDIHEEAKSLGLEVLGLPRNEQGWYPCGTRPLRTDTQPPEDGA